MHWNDAPGVANSKIWSLKLYSWYNTPSRIMIIYHPVVIFWCLSISSGFAGLVNMPTVCLSFFMYSI